jgi:putative ABC transport system permease protein
VVGKTVEANFMPYRIIGVMPPGFAFPSGGDEAWISMGFQVPRPTRERTLRRWVVLGRLRPGAGADSARRDTAAIGQRLAALHPEDAGRRLEAVPFRRAAIDDNLRQSGLAVLAAVVAVLLIACANITDLLLAHAVERRREIAVRAALGATPRRIIRQLLTESLLFALLGGALGLALGAAGVHFLRGILPPLPYGFELTVDPLPLAAALAVAVVAGLLFGTAPALQASRPDLAEAFHDGGRIPWRPGRLHAGLVVFEVALSAVLLLSASLAVRSLSALRAETAGIDPQHLLTVWVPLAGDRNREEEVRAGTLRALVERLTAWPGIEAAAAANFVPLAANNGTLTRIAEVEGMPPGANRQNHQEALCTAVTSGFFRTAGTPLLAGRDLTAAEASVHSSAAVVSSSLVHSLWPDARAAAQAVGRRFRLADPAIPGWLTVVGVAGDLKMESLREGSRPQVYFSAAYNIYRPAALLVRTRMPREEALAAVRRAVHAVDPSSALFLEATMDEVRSAALHVERLSSGGLALFGAAALFFAAVGTYGILAGAVVRRRKEIALRLALGAPRGVLLRRLIGRGMALTLAGLALGLPAGLAVCRALAGNLYGVTPTDPVSYAGVAILLLDVAFIACWLPARKALEIEPAEVLREG